MKKILVGLVALFVGCATAPPHPPVITPPTATEHTVTVHVFEGLAVSDHKAVGARVTAAAIDTRADGAGNVSVVLPLRDVEVCAEADGYARTCGTASADRGDLDLELARLVSPVLPVRVDGRFWITDAGTYRPIFQSGLTLLVRGPPERAAFLDETRALGFNGVRVFAGSLAWAGQTPEQARAMLPTLLDEAAARGLSVYVSAITDSGTGYDVVSHLRAVAGICAAHAGCLLEVANEIGHPTQSGQVNDVAWLRGVARLGIPSGVPWALGSGETDEATAAGVYPTDGGLFNDAHLDRGRDTWNQVRRLREIAGISEATRKPAMSGEPIGAADPEELTDPATGRPRQRRTDPEFFFAMGALCRGFELGCVFHSQDGLEARPLGPTTRACAEAFIAGWRALATDERLQFLNAKWANSPVTSANFHKDDAEEERRDPGTVVRAFSFVAGGRGWLVFVGLTGDPRVELGNGWHQVRVVAERTGVRVVEIAR